MGTAKVTDIKELKRIYHREWRSKNAEKLKTAQREWRKRNPEKVKEYNERYWAKKAESLQAATKQG